MGRAKDMPVAKEAPGAAAKDDAKLDPAEITDAAEADAEHGVDPQGSDALDAAGLEPAEMPVSQNPFGSPAVIVHKKEDGGVGIPASVLQGKPLEEGYVPPEERSNPEYLAKLKAEKDLAYTEFAKREKAARAMGFGSRAVIFGASPNSPQGGFKTID